MNNISTNSIKFLHRIKCQLNYKCILYIFIILTLSLYIRNIRLDLRAQLLPITQQYKTLQILNENKFILNHLFHKSNDVHDVIKYLKKSIKKYFGKVVNIKTIDKSNIEKLFIHQLELSLLFWHDQFIFNLLNDINNYSPGFIRVTYLQINKISNPQTIEPTLSVKILCDLYCKS